MKPLLLTLAILFTIPTMLDAQSLDTYRWKSRLILLFTPTPENPLYVEQMRLLKAQSAEFEERDVLFIALTPQGKYDETGCVSDESLARQYYQHFKPAEEQFELILVGLDSGEKLRAQNTLTQSFVLLELIDGMPMRRQQIRRGNGGND